MSRYFFYMHLNCRELTCALHATSDCITPSMPRFASESHRSFRARRVAAPRPGQGGICRGAGAAPRGFASESSGKPALSSLRSAEGGCSADLERSETTRPVQKYVKRVGWVYSTHWGNLPRVKRSTAIVIAFVVLLLAGAGATIAYLARENFALKVELGTLRYKLEAAATASPPARPSGGEVSADRTISDLTRRVMLDTLSTETGTEKKLWVRVDPRDDEAAEFARQIADVFRDAGWEVLLLDNQGVRFKAGMLMLIGVESTPASYVQTAQRALQALRDPVKVGTGYIAYYEKMKKETPDWKGGVAFLPGQTYVLFVGRKPEPTPEQ